ncbi:hypothetical protein V5799_025310 [Amblyomma americanum]|uniref:Uncharacterized protein n=1 Tax=Amblyomma americanum TaxID=6943 RepID=A0AAQ4E9M8_AMBAM
MSQRGLPQCFLCDMCASHLRSKNLHLDFFVHAQILYGRECMTYNMYQLLHIGKSVQLWGPLWAHSAFLFEAGNGTLKEAVKAANGIPHQVSSSTVPH